MQNGSLSLNSACPELNLGTGPNPNLAAFTAAAFGSAIFITVVAVPTILANGALLLTFYVDPLKTFRNPTSYFLIGLTIVDLLTALVQEPIYATCFMFLYFRHPLTPKCRPFMNAMSDYFGAVVMTVSFLIIFAFTLTQYIVVSSPLKYARFVTSRKVLISVVAIYFYSTTFWCLQLTGVPGSTLEIIDLILHYCLMIFITIAIYILLHRVMKKKMTAGNKLQGPVKARGEESKHAQVQRNFLRVNFLLLVVLITCSMPSAVTWTILSFSVDSKTPPVKVYIIQLMADNLIYLKFLLDPFVYAWRMMKYREAFYKSVRRQQTGTRSKGKQSNVTERESGMVLEMSSITTSVTNAPSATSVVSLLSFKELKEK